MKLKETRILDAEGARYACIANDYCTRCDCEEYDRILSDADTSSRKPGGITVDDLARIAEAIKAVSETDDDVPAIAFALSRRTMSRTLLSGEIPSPVRPADYEPEVPPLKEVTPGHFVAQQRMADWF